MGLRVDIAVVGGGPAGVSAAVNLVREGFSVYIVADRLRQAFPPGETLPPQACMAMRNLGLPKAGLESAVVPSFGIEAAWGGHIPIFYSQMSDPLGSGWHVNRSAFHELFLDATCGTGAGVLRGRFWSAVRGKSSWTVSVEIASGSEELYCDFLIDASGRKAAVAQSLGLRRQRFDALCGISGVLESPAPTQLLLVESAPYGWWYVAPLPASRTMACLISDADIIRRLGAWRLDIWGGLLQETQFVSGSLKMSSSRPPSLRAHPCETMILDQVAGDAWLAVGDAASVFDPLSSAGVLKALESGRDAAASVARYLAGDAYAPRRYSEQCSEIFHNYLANRLRHYAMESRWRKEPFWARRAA